MSGSFRLYLLKYTPYILFFFCHSLCLPCPADLLCLFCCIFPMKNVTVTQLYVNFVGSTCLCRTNQRQLPRPSLHKPRRSRLSLAFADNSSFSPSSAFGSCFSQHYQRKTPWISRQLKITVLCPFFSQFNHRTDILFRYYNAGTNDFAPAWLRLQGLCESKGAPARMQRD